MKKILVISLFVSFICTGLFGQSKLDRDLLNKLSEFSIKNLVESTSFENEFLESSKSIILINDELRKSASVENDFEVVDYNNEKVYFLSKTHLFESDVKTYIEFTKIKVKRRKVTVEYNLMYRVGLTDKVVKSGKSSMRRQ